MIRIVTIDDDSFQPTDAPDPGACYRRVVLNRVQSKREILIAPHCHETYLSIQLLKLAIHCRENGIRLVSVGTMNQLPFFGMFSDEVIVRPSALEPLFSPESSFGFHPAPWAALPAFVDVYGPQFPGRWPLDEITPDAVVRVFGTPTIYLRRSTCDVFEALGLKDDRICCEVKRHFFPRLSGVLEALNDDRVVGLDKTFQRGLVARVGDHFMGLQILASVYKRWRFIAAGGAVNLFNVIPVHPLLFIENQADFTLEYQDIARALCRARFGTHPTLIGFPYRIYQGRALDDDDTVTEAIVRQALAGTSAPVPSPMVVSVALNPARRPAAGERSAWQAGRTFLYTRAGYPDVEITLGAGGTIAGGPGHYEHGWIQEDDGLVFFSPDGVPRVRLRADGSGRYAGTFVNSGARTEVRLYPRAPTTI